MTTQSIYTYVVLRYRHDPLVAEFANVGLILHQASSGFLGARVRHTLGRLSAMFPDLDGEASRDSLRTIDRALQRLGQAEGGDLLTASTDASAFARRVLPADDSSFVWGPVGSGTSNNPADTLAKLYERFVARYDGRPYAHRDDAAVWRPVREKLAGMELAGRLRPKTIASPLDRIEFDHAWKNGAWHCVQPLSFDLTNEENIRDKARRWLGHLLALRGASEGFKLYFLVGAPSEPELESAYRAGLKILALSPGDPEVFEEAQSDELVGRIAEELHVADGSNDERHPS